MAVVARLKVATATAELATTAMENILENWLINWLSVVVQWK